MNLLKNSKCARGKRGLTGTGRKTKAKRKAWEARQVSLSRGSKS